MSQSTWIESSIRRCWVVGCELPREPEQLRCVNHIDTPAPMTSAGLSYPTSAASFRPHFDYQLGYHFTSPEEKAAVLAQKGKVQLGGEMSPQDRKREGKGSPEMSRTQFQKWRAQRKEKARATRLKKELQARQAGTTT